VTPTLVTDPNFSDRWPSSGCDRQWHLVAERFDNADLKGTPRGVARENVPDAFRVDQQSEDPRTSVYPLAVNRKRCIILARGGLSRCDRVLRHSIKRGRAPAELNHRLRSRRSACLPHRTQVPTRSTAWRLKRPGSAPVVGPLGVCLGVCRPSHDRKLMQLRTLRTVFDGPRNHQPRKVPVSSWSHSALRRRGGVSRRASLSQRYSRMTPGSCVVRWQDSEDSQP
jgi:hypothetical protein